MPNTAEQRILRQVKLLTLTANDRNHQQDLSMMLAYGMRRLQWQR